MITILLGILSSVAAEVVTAINKRLTGTVLAGDGAFLVAFGMALPAALIKEVVAPGFSWHDLTNLTTLAQDFTETFTVSQVYFLIIVQKLGLDVRPDVNPAAPAVSAGV